jgi:hypothetical protein
MESTEVAGLSGWRIRPSALTQRLTSVAFVSPALSAMLTGPVERVAMMVFSSQFDPGLVFGPHLVERIHVQTVGEREGLVIVEKERD